ncbi:MAG: ATPase domain-containing protein [Alphaproteobacteria bacterium]
MTKIAAATPTIQTGIAEFNDLLGGGLAPNRVYLLNGSPGSGKTTLSLQFLVEGASKGEKVLYVTLSETKEELLAVAASHGISLDGVEIHELVASEADLDPENQYTMYQPSEVELSLTTKAILDAVDRLKPSRLVIDSLSEIKLLAQSALRFRRQVLALKQFFSGRQCTVWFLDDKTTTGEEDLQLESIAHGVISLEQLAPEYGAERRRIRISKLRGQRYRGGYHDFTIVKGGLKIFPRIVASEHTTTLKLKPVKCGIPEIDAMLGGGIDSGTSVLLLGPAGVGKSSLALRYAVEAAKKKERAVIFTFDERMETLLHRCKGLGMPLESYIAEGLIDLQAIDPAELSPGEFAHKVRHAVEGTDGKNPAKVVVIDSLNGYLNAMPDERHLISQLHELLTYLGHLGVLSFLVVAQHGFFGSAVQAPIDTSYLADTVILFRYFETAGEIRQLISVMKKRSGVHERTLREFIMDGNGIRAGKPLQDFHGLLTGTPIYSGTQKGLLTANDRG